MRTLGFEGDIDLLEHLHGVWPASLLLSVEEDVALLRHSAMDHVKEDGPKRLLHVGADPDQEPIVELHGGGEDRPDARASADGDASAEEVGKVRKTSELRTSVRI